jgi:hypothetical protein
MNHVDHGALPSPWPALGRSLYPEKHDQKNEDRIEDDPHDVGSPTPPFYPNAPNSSAGDGVRRGLFAPNSSPYSDAEEIMRTMCEWLDTAPFRLVAITR